MGQTQVDATKRSSASGPHVRVLLHEATLPPDVRWATTELHASLSVHDFLAGPQRPAEPSDACLIVSNARDPIAGSHAAALKAWFDCDPCATLVLSRGPMNSGVVPEETLAGRSISSAGQMSREALLGRLSAMCEMSRSMRRLQAELVRLREQEQRLAVDFRKLHEELGAAVTLQRSFLPASLPKVDGGCINVIYRPADALSGDIYDVYRLDDAHVAICLADATGHGVSAALLSAFVKRSLKGLGVGQATTSIPGPDEVLAYLNRELLDLNLGECHFVAALFAVYNEREKTLRWARGGAPYPIYRRRNHRPRRITTEGPLVGVISEAGFEVAELSLGAGDSVLFHSDGLDVSLGAGPADKGISGRHRDDWLEDLAGPSSEAWVPRLESLLAEAPTDDPKRDDTTVISLMVDARIPAAGPAVLPSRPRVAVPV